jgi:hypothetical protein
MSLSDWAAYEQLFVGSACAARVKRLGPGSGLVEEAGIVAAVEALAPCGIPDGLLRGSSDGVLRWRHMAISAGIVAAE